MRYSFFQYFRAAEFFTLYGLVKYLPPPVGDAFRFAVLKLFVRRIASWKIKDGISIWFPEGISIGRHVTINEGVFMDGFGGLEIGDHCRIALVVPSSAKIASSTIPTSRSGNKARWRGVS